MQLIHDLEATRDETLSYFALGSQDLERMRSPAGSKRQIDQAIRLNDIILLVLSENSTNSDWVEQEARKVREKEKQIGKDVLGPVALDDSWKSCRWPERLREQIKEYNILNSAPFVRGSVSGR